MSDLVLWLDQLRLSDLGQVGGKNASLGEMIGNLSKLGVSVPGGFATTAFAFQQFIAQSGLAERIQQRLAGLDVDDVDALVKAGTEIRGWVIDTPRGRPRRRRARSLRAAVQDGRNRQHRGRGAFVGHGRGPAGRASFAGQQETFLNVTGADDVIHKVKEVFASLYNDRAIAYRVHHGFKHEDVFLSAGIQLMVRSDVGVRRAVHARHRDPAFATPSSSPSYGLGELVVQGAEPG